MSKLDATILLALNISRWCRLTNYHPVEHFIVFIPRIYEGLLHLWMGIGTMGIDLVVRLAGHLPTMIDLDKFA